VSLTPTAGALPVEVGIDFDPSLLPEGEEAAALPLWERPWFQRTVVWGGLVVAWQIVAMIAGSFFLPAIPDIARGFWRTLTNGDFAGVLTSYRQMLIGFGLAVLIGVPIGILLGLSAVFRAAFGWIVDVLFVTSLVALLPFLILLAGTDLEFRVVVVFLFAIFYLIMNPAAGVRSVDPGLREMAASYRASRWRMARSVIAPSVLPFILAGMRLGMGQAIQGMIVAELWIAAGTGRRLSALGLARKLGEFFALAAVIVILGVLLIQLFFWIQRRFTPWASELQGVSR
jgi:ABC-type nitrate/sulfonate/bicarbonate transport system permease component